VQQSSSPLDGTQSMNTEVTSTHTFLQVPYEIQDVASGVVAYYANQQKQLNNYLS